MATAVRSSTEISEKHRIPTLDGWRGVAILLVLVGHFSQRIYPSEPRWVSHISQHGVAIFFVLSGFLITTLLTGERQRCGSINLWRFYVRRLFRLMPCAWCYLAALPLMEARERLKLFNYSEILGCLFFFRNYLDHASQHPITAHFWSLSIEEQFYLFWPSMLVLLGGRRSLRLALTCAVLIAAWRFLHWTELSQSRFMVSTGTQYRADALLVGCASALTMPHIKPLLRPWMVLPILAAIGWCVVRNPDLIPLHESILIALLLMATSQCETSLFRPLDWKPIAFLGTISYSIYIWQQPFTLFSDYSLSSVLFLTLPKLLIVSCASFYCVERPMIRLGRRFL